MFLVNNTTRYSLGEPSSIGRTLGCASSSDGILAAVVTQRQVAICTATGTVRQISHVAIDLDGHDGPVSVAWRPSPARQHTAYTPARTYTLVVAAPTVAVIIEVGDATVKAPGWLDWLMGDDSDEDATWSVDALPDYTPRVTALVRARSGAHTFTAAAALSSHVLLGRSDAVLAAATWDGKLVYEAELKSVSAAAREFRVTHVCAYEGACVVVAFASGIIISASLAYEPFLHIPQSSIRLVCAPERRASSTGSSAPVAVRTHTHTHAHAHAVAAKPSMPPPPSGTPRASGSAPSASITSLSLARVDDGSFVLGVGLSDGEVEVFRSAPYTHGAHTRTGMHTSSSSGALPAVVAAASSAVPVPSQSARASAQAATPPAGALPYIVALAWQPCVRFTAHAHALEDSHAAAVGGVAVRGIAWRVHSMPRAAAVPIAYEALMLPEGGGPAVPGISVDVLHAAPNQACLCVFTASQCVSFWGVRLHERALSLLQVSVLDGMYSEPQLQPSSPPPMAPSIMFWANGAFSAFVGLPEACPALPARDGLVYMSAAASSVAASSGAPAPQSSGALAAASNANEDDEDVVVPPQQPHIARMDVADALGQGSSIGGRFPLSLSASLAPSSTTWCVSSDGVFSLIEASAPRRPHGAQLMDDHSGSLVWDAQRVTSHYLPANAPLRMAVASPDAAAVAVAGARGAAIYFRRKKQWRVFSTPTQEASVVAHGMAWLGDRALMILHRARETPGGAKPKAAARSDSASVPRNVFVLQAYPRTHLDVSMQLCAHPVPVAPGMEPQALMCGHTDVWLPSKDGAPQELATCARILWCAVLLSGRPTPAPDGMVASAADVSTTPSEGISGVHEVHIQLYRAKYTTSRATLATVTDSAKRTGTVLDVILAADAVAPVDTVAAVPPGMDGADAVAKTDAELGDGLPDPAMCHASPTPSSDELGKPSHLRQVAHLRLRGEQISVTAETVPVRPATGLHVSMHCTLKLPAQLVAEGLVAVHVLSKDVRSAAAPGASGDEAASGRQHALPGSDAWRSTMPDFLLQTRTGAVYILHSASAYAWPLFRPEVARASVLTPRTDSAPKPPVASAHVALMEPRAVGNCSASTVVFVHHHNASIVYARGATLLGDMQHVPQGSVGVCRPLLASAIEHRAHKVQAASLVGHSTLHAGAAVVVHAGSHVPALPTDTEHAAALHNGRGEGARKNAPLLPVVTHEPARGIRLVPTLHLLLRCLLLRGLEVDWVASGEDPLLPALATARLAVASHPSAAITALRALLHDAIEADKAACASDGALSPVSTAVLARLRNTRQPVGARSHATAVIRVNGLSVDVLEACGGTTLSILRPLADALRVYMRSRRFTWKEVFGAAAVADADGVCAEGQSDTPSGSLYLHAVLTLLRRLDALLDVVSLVGRTIEEDHLPFLFPAAGLPRDLFRTALRRALALAGGDANALQHNATSVEHLRIAAAFMLLVQEYAWRTLTVRNGGPDRAVPAVSLSAEAMSPELRVSALSILGDNMDDAVALLEAVGVPPDVATNLVGARPSHPSFRDHAPVPVSAVTSELMESLRRSCRGDIACLQNLMSLVESTSAYTSRLRVAAEEITAASEAHTRSSRTKSTAQTALVVAPSSAPAPSWGVVGTVAYYLGWGGSSKSSATAAKEADPADGSDATTDATLRALRETCLEVLAQSSAVIHRRPSGDFGLALVPSEAGASLRPRDRAVPDDLRELLAGSHAGKDLEAVIIALDKARELQGQWIQAQLRGAQACVGGLMLADVVRGDELMPGDVVQSVEATPLVGIPFQDVVHALEAAPKDANISFLRVAAVPVLAVLRVLMPQ